MQNNMKKKQKLIAEAGKIGAVTIATNMAGSGTDIKLGEIKILILEGQNSDDIEKIKIDETKVKDLGGCLSLELRDTKVEELIINYVEELEDKGDPGSSIFYISLQDELMRIFGGDSIDGMLKNWD